MLLQPCRKALNSTVHTHPIRDVDLSTPPAEDLRNDFVRDDFGRQHERLARDERGLPIFDQRGLRPHRVHDRGLDAAPVRTVAEAEFLVQTWGSMRVSICMWEDEMGEGERTFVQGEHARFGCAVVGQTCRSKVACHASEGENVALLLLEHSGEELLDQRPVAEQIHAEDLLEPLFRCVQDRVTRCDAGIIDQDGGHTNIFTDCGCSLLD